MIWNIYTIQVCRGEMIKSNIIFKFFLKHKSKKYVGTDILKIMKNKYSLPPVQVYYVKMKNKYPPYPQQIT